MTPLLELDGMPEPFNCNRQTLPTVWAQTGNIELVRTLVIREKKSMSGSVIRAVSIESDYYVDIDTLTSFQIAELTMNQIDCIAL